MSFVRLSFAVQYVLHPAARYSLISIVRLSCAVKNVVHPALHMKLLPCQSPIPGSKYTNPVMEWSLHT